MKAIFDVKNTITINVLICLICCALFLPFLGSAHLFDWDEINFAECAREMIVSGNYSLVTINFQAFWEKPPLFIWMQVISMKLFGINEFASRFPNAICGIITAIVLFNIGRNLHSNRFGILWILTFIGSFLPHFYFKSGIIDPWFNLFIFLGVYYMSLNTFQENSKTKYGKNILLSSFFIGLGILTKGPVALLIYAICIFSFWAKARFKKILSFYQILSSIAIIAFVGGFWFIIQLVNGHADTVLDFINYQIRLFNTEDSGHGGPIYYHVLVLLLGCFPASLFALLSIKKNNSDKIPIANFKVWMAILFLVVLILFSIVKTKILHYSSLCYFPLSFLAAYSIEKIYSGETKVPKVINWSIGLIGFIFGLIFLLPPIIHWNRDWIIKSDIIKDQFAIENFNAEVTWSTLNLLPGIIYISGVLCVLYLLKKGSCQWVVNWLFILSLLVVNLVSILFVPKIEKYVQGAAINFYEGLVGKECYVETLGFKSYAHYFYAKVLPSSNVNRFNTNWLLNGDIDKPAYFVSKIGDANDILKNNIHLKELYRKNGFVFFYRNIPDNNVDVNPE